MASLRGRAMAPTTNSRLEDEETVPESEVRSVVRIPLVLGTSLVKHVPSRVMDGTVKVEYKPGASLSDLRSRFVTKHVDQGQPKASVENTVSNVKNVPESESRESTEQKIATFSKIVIVGGGNDLWDKNSQDVVSSMKELIHTVKESRATGTDGDITISAILPRIGAAHFNVKVQETNLMLKKLCEMEQVAFKDCTSKFVLKDESINITAYEDDVHPTPFATEMLLTALGLEDSLKFKNKGEQNYVASFPRMRIRIQNTVKLKPGEAWVGAAEIVRGIPSEYLEDVAQIEKKMHGVWTVTSKSTKLYEELKQNGMKINGATIQCYDIDEQVKKAIPVELTGLPFQFTDSFIKGCLEKYGQVDSLKRHHHPGTNIFNGLATVHMKPEATIPKAIRIAENVIINVRYEGQRDMCRICQSTSHFTSKCSQRVCYICHEQSHIAENCPRAKTCHFCGLKGHLQRSCKTYKTEQERINQNIAQEIQKAKEESVRKQNSKDKLENKNNDRDTDHGQTSTTEKDKDNIQLDEKDEKGSDMDTNSDSELDNSGITNLPDTLIAGEDKSQKRSLDDSITMGSTVIHPSSTPKHKRVKKGRRTNGKSKK